MAFSLGLPLFLFAAPVRAQVILSAFSSDQQVQKPSSSVTLTATLTQPQTQGDWHIQSANINIDGVDYPATIGSTTSIGDHIIVTTLTYVWDASSAGNPSEHKISASAMVQFEYEAPPSGDVKPIKSTFPAFTGGGLATDFYGDGREADFIIADLRLKSLTFTGSVSLRYSASASPAPTPDPALVPTPQLAFDQNGKVTASLPPMAYTEGTSIPFSIELYPLTGQATVGYTIDLSAKPTATNEAGIALYQTGTTPQTFTNPLPLTSTAALYTEVNRYATILADLRFWVQFTNSTKNWAIVSTYADAGHQPSNTIYALLSSPSAPMDKPWVSVLDYACKYAAGTSDSAAATTALTKGLYNNGHYNGGYRQFSSGRGGGSRISDGIEFFQITGFENAALVGECEDFANFLVCMNNAVGASPLQSQRSASVSDIAYGAGFTTNPITWSSTQTTPTMSQPGSSVHWTYHQWATSSNVFDGSILFGGVTSPNNIPLTSFYQNLVSATDHNYPANNACQDWRPMGAFLPTPIN